MKKLFFAIIISITTNAAAQQNPELRKFPLHVPEKFAQFYSGSDSLFLPRGFKISVFHAGIENPRFMAWHNGVLHVANMLGHEIYALPDKNNDGIADTALVAVSGVDSAHSIAFYGNALYVAEPSRVRRCTDADNDGIFETKENFITGIHSTGPYNHWSRTILIDSLGGKIFLGVGASCNACREEFPERGSILSFNLDGSGRKIFASGLRNPIGLTIEPATGQLWATNADRDRIGDEIPPEIITHIEENGFYGWPFAYGNHEWVDFSTAPEEYQAMLPLTAADSAKVANMLVADVQIRAHSTPMGIYFYTGSQFPAEYKNSAFVAVHGSSNGGRPGKPIGYKMILLHKNSFGGWSAQDFLTGFLTSDTSYQFWGRPCGVTCDDAGNLYLSSDRGIGAIYKISYDPSLGAEENFSSEFPLDIRETGNSNYEIHTENFEGRILLEIFGIEGAKILSKEFFAEGKFFSGNFSLENFSSGVYFCRLTATGEKAYSTVKKIFVLN